MHQILRFALLILVFTFSKSLFAQSPRIIIDSLLIQIQEDLTTEKRAVIYSELGNRPL